MPWRNHLLPRIPTTRHRVGVRWQTVNRRCRALACAPVCWGTHTGLDAIPGGLGADTHGTGLPLLAGSDYRRRRLASRRARHGYGIPQPAVAMLPGAARTLPLYNAYMSVTALANLAPPADGTYDDLDIEFEIVSGGGAVDANGLITAPQVAM